MPSHIIFLKIITWHSLFWKSLEKLRMLVCHSLFFFFVCRCHVMLNDNIVDWYMEHLGFKISMLDSRLRVSGSSSSWGQGKSRRGVLTSQKLNLWNYGIGWHIRKEQDGKRSLAKNQPFSANWCADTDTCTCIGNIMLR